MAFKKAYSPAWEHYIEAEDKYPFKDDQVGAWKCYFDYDFDELHRIQKICQELIEDGIAAEAKHFNQDAMIQSRKGEVLFFCNADDIEAHKRIIAFMIKHDLLRKDDYDNYRNMAFVYSSTVKRKKGSRPVQLVDFIDLRTGCFNY